MDVETEQRLKEQSRLWRSKKKLFRGTCSLAAKCNERDIKQFALDGTVELIISDSRTAFSAIVDLLFLFATALPAMLKFQFGLSAI